MIRILMALLAVACSAPMPVLRTIPAADGIPMTVELSGPAVELTVVFVHCWSGNRNFWKEQIADLSRDHAVLAFDLPGHGDSGSGRANWRIADFGRDVQTVVESLGLRRVILVGHSMGGPVSLEAARLLPGRVIGVIAVDTLHDAEFRYPPEMATGMAARYEADFRGTMDGMLRWMFGSSGEPELVSWVVSEALRTDPAASIGLLKDFPNLDMRKAFAAAGVPIRAINAMPQGDLGLPTAIETNRRYADFDAVLMEGVGHFLQLERPVEFNAHLRRFLNELDR